jgi:hypothetical protein
MENLDKLKENLDKRKAEKAGQARSEEPERAPEDEK